MPFGTFAIESAFFLGLLTILSSLPADPYFQPWYDGPPTYGISQTFYNPLAARGNPGFPNQFFYGPPPQDDGYPLDTRGPTPRNQKSQRRSEPYPGDEYPGDYSSVRIEVQNFGNPFSSHVNCGGNQKDKEKPPENIRESIEQIFGLDNSKVAEETLAFAEGSRNGRRSGNADAEVPNPRIVTPKRGRRPAQGIPTKNQGRPGATNAISTTEKTFTNQTKGTKRPGQNRHRDNIVFPDRFTKKFIPRVTKCGKKATFCQHLEEEYPSEYIRQILKSEGPRFKEFFGNDVISDPNITERINVPDENSLCPYRQEVVFPKAAQNKEDKWLFVINQDQYVQGVTVEVCLNPESRCILTEGFPLGYTPYCKQKYIERRLLAIGEDGKPHSDSFRLPSCCSCVVKHETTGRMGFLLSSERDRGAPQQ